MTGPTRFDAEVSDQAQEILGEVTLDHFTADPTTIAPFGWSLLSWRVDGPPGFQVRLNNVTVPRTSTRTVQPTEATTYRLFARVGPYSRFLGLVTVNVDVGQCRSGVNQFAAAMLKNALQTGIDARDDVYFRAVPRRDAYGRVRYVTSEPVVTITPGRIEFSLRLGGRINNFPDPSIDVDARFGLTVSADFPTGRSIVPNNEDIKVDASAPWYAWLIPGAVIALPIALGNAEDRTRAAMRDAIRRFVNEGITGYFSLVEVLQGLEPHTVRIETDEAEGHVEGMFCPVVQPPIVE